MSAQDYLLEEETEFLREIPGENRAWLAGVGCFLAWCVRENRPLSKTSLVLWKRTEEEVVS